MVVFKPFKPPLIRKPPQLEPEPEPEKEKDSRHNPSTSTDPDVDVNPPPNKKPRLSSDSDNGTKAGESDIVDKDESLFVRTTDGGTGILNRTCTYTYAHGNRNRKHLHQVVRNVVTDPDKISGTKDVSTSSSSSAAGDGDGSVGERYYNVLWRKFTTKKHKTWDGDGILSARGGYVYLQDISGKEMGRAKHDSHLEPGTMLSVGGKEVEVDSEMSRQEYLSGRRFLEVTTPTLTTTTTVKRSMPPVVFRRKESALVKGPSSNKTEAAPEDKAPVRNAASKGVKSAYKNPLLESTVMPQTPTGKPVPRHDPNAPGALVMKRPDSVPRGKRIVDVVVDPLVGKHLREHQREGVKFLYECVMGMRSFNGEGAILADDMGLGKTLQTITLLWTLLKQNPIYEEGPVVRKALIVCPVTLINNWRKEFRKWLGNERIGVFVFDDKRKRLTDFTMGKAYSVMIVGYEKLRTVQEGLARGAGVDIIIADEGHRLKTLQNKSGQAIQSLNATKRVILSGTPIQNDLREFFAAVDLVNPGILGTFKAFIREFEGPIVRSRQPEATKRDIEKGEARNEELRNLTSLFILRRTADILAKYLPPKTEYVLFCNPTPAQANIYRNVLASPMFQCAVGNSESALQLITILKKLCNSPSLLSKNVDDDKSSSHSDTINGLLSSLPPKLLRHFTPSSSAKIRVLDQLLHNLRTSTTEKIVLVSNYTSTLNLLATLLSSLSLPFLRLDGSTPAQKRQSLVDDFNRLPADRCFAFLLSAKAGGTGLNLIGASRLVLFDVDWNPATDIQAMARIHRDGQKRHCRIYRVLLKGSLEEKIWQRQVTKIGLADSVMERKNSVAQFSREELRDLFRLDEESRCQTHELLGCECGGRGRGPETLPDNNNDGEAETTTVTISDSESEGELTDDSDLPDFPTLIKASELRAQMEEEKEKEQRQQKQKQKRGTRSTTTRTQPHRKTSHKQKSKIQESLSQYVHIDPSLLLSSVPGHEIETETEKEKEKQTETEEEEEEGAGKIDADADVGIDIEVEQEIDDDLVLLPLLKDEDNRVDFIFKKSSSG